MVVDGSQSQEADLDRTDKLRILEGVVFDHDMEDDAVRLDQTSVLPGSPVIAGQPTQSDFARPPAVDLPSLAESVRSVEERIARQGAEYDALRRRYEKVRDAEAAALVRANALAADLAAAQSSLAVEQHRSREMDRALADRNATAEAARARAEEALRDAERHRSESRMLRDALAARDATLEHAQHSLGERDAQLHALQREHAKIVPALEARSQASAQLEAELQSARGHMEEIALELQGSQQSAAALTARLKHSESELHAARGRNWAPSSGSRALTWKICGPGIGAAASTRICFSNGTRRRMRLGPAIGALQAERDRLKQTAAALSGKLIEQDETIAKLRGAAAADAATLDKKARGAAGEPAHARGAELHGSMRWRASASARTRELVARDQALAEARAQSVGEAQRVKELLAAARQEDMPSRRRKSRNCNQRRKRMRRK